MGIIRAGLPPKGEGVADEHRLVEAETHAFLLLEKSAMSTGLRPQLPHTAVVTPWRRDSAAQ